jgi:hypothetical protein
MTIEKICFVDVEDIKELRVSCAKCGAASTLPVNQLSNVASLVGGLCVACGTEPGVRRGTNEWNRIIGFIDHLEQIKEALKGRNIKLSFRIDCEPTKSVSQKSEPEQ